MAVLFDLPRVVVVPRPDEGLPTTQPPLIVPARSQETRPADDGRPADLGVLPEQLIARYVAAAVRRARTEQLDDGSWYAVIDLLPGVWGEGASEQSALDDLRGVTEAWVLFKIEDRDRDIPKIDSLDLNWL